MNNKNNIIIREKDYISKICMIIIFLILIFILELREYKNVNSLIKKPKVSVFLPIYNKDKYLFRSINSIQAQTLKDIEIVTVNDGSTDNTLKILKKLSKKDKRIKIINNSRNHGLLYSRAMGILNSSGEYLMNLDPDDKLEGKYDLEILYNKAKKSNLDYILFLIKRIPKNKCEEKKYDLMNKLQLTKEDFLITNKFIKRNLFLIAYNIFRKEIYQNKWNYHEDSIWNQLIKRYGNNSETFNKYIYIYKRNEDSLNMGIGNMNEIKNRIYRLKKNLIIKKENNNNSYVNHYQLYQYYESIINISNASILTNREIKNPLIDLSYKLFFILNKNNTIINSINNIMNKISYNKIILFFNSLNKTLIDYLPQLSLFQILTELGNRKIISIDINNDIQFNNIFQYIYPNDILVGFEDIINQSNFIKIMKCNNKIIILGDNININIQDKNIISMNNSNYILYLSNQINEYNIKKNLYYIPEFLINLANYINSRKQSNNNLIIFCNEYNYKYMKDVKKISSKYFNKVNYINLSERDKNKIDLLEIINKNKLILTDSIHIMELSSLHFTSCIYFENTTKNYVKKKKLNYIKHINNINELEKNILDLNSKSTKKRNEKLFYNCKNLLIKIFR